MLFKSAFRQLKKNKFMNTLIIIQLAAVMSIICVLVSMLESRMEYYLPFKEEFSSSGYLCNFDIGSNEKEICDNLGGAKCEFTYYDYLAVNGQSFEKDVIPQTIILSDKWLSAYTPAMKSGKWLDKNTNNKICSAVVTPDNPLNLKTGDSFTLTNQDGNTTQAVVIGVMENKQYSVGASFFSQTDLTNRNNFFDMYYTYNSEVELSQNQWGIYLTENEYKNSSLYSGTMSVKGMGFVLTDTMSLKAYNEINEKLLTQYSPLYTVPLEEINVNSFAYIKEQMYVLLPIAICIFILTMITTISVISISINSQLKTYAIFYICGAKWRDCSLISFIYSLIICVISAILSCVALLIIIWKSQTVIKFGIYEIGAMFIIALIFLGLSAIIPIAVTHNNQPKDILKKE